MNIVKHPSAWIVPVPPHVLAPSSAIEQVKVQPAARTAPHPVDDGGRFENAWSGVWRRFEAHLFHRPGPRAILTA
jgi:hypothetical protein